MADAPSSGGGSSWGPFEVVLVLLLVIAIFSNLGGKNTSTPTFTEPKKTTLTPIDTSANRCGLSITSPVSLTKIDGLVRLSGSITGCNWKPDGNIALFAQVINGGGAPVSDFITVTNDGTDLINTAFNTTIYLNDGTPTGTGYLILIPAIQDPNKPITVRIPLKLVRYH